MPMAMVQCVAKLEDGTDAGKFWTDHVPRKGDHVWLGDLFIVRNVVHTSVPSLNVAATNCSPLV
jgi:hypothetical protein